MTELTHGPLSVQDCFERLAQTWTAYEADPETGALVAREAPALLLELRGAVFGGMESTGGTSGFRARLPISDGALDLYEAIDQEIAEAWAHAFPGQVPTVDTPERLLSQLVAVTKPDEVVSVLVAEQRVDHAGTRFEHWWVERKPVEYTVAALMRRWVKQITEFFDPPRTREITGPCIQCDTEWDWKVVDGERQAFRVFVFVEDAGGTTREARCLACGASWGPAFFRYIAAHLQPGVMRPRLVPRDELPVDLR